MKKSENEACILAALYVAGFGIACYLQSFGAFMIITLYFITLLACSWRIERLERRIKYYRKTLNQQIHDELEQPELGSDKPEVKVTKGGKSA